MPRETPWPKVIAHGGWFNTGARAGEDTDSLQLALEIAPIAGPTAGGGEGWEGAMIRQLHIAWAVLAACALSGCDVAAEGTAAPDSIAMKQDGGVYVVPASVNGLVSLDCVVDSGASDVNIPADAFRKLLRAGTVKKSDFLGTTTYTLADGTDEPSRTFRIRTLKVGNIVMHNVVASIGGTGSTALLGQSFLGRFRSWSLDNAHHALMLAGPQSAAPPPDTDDDDADAPPVQTAGPGTTSRASHGGDSDGPEPVSVAQVSGHGSGAPHRSRRPPDPDDDRLTAQHSESH